jgi:hypothetical protein
MKRKTCSLRLVGLAVAIAASIFVGAPTPSLADTAPKCPVHEVVKTGDNLFRIGLKYGVSWTVLQRLNGIHDPNRIYPGQIVCLPNDAKVANPPINVPVPSVPPAPPPPATSFMPPAGVYPTIAFSTYVAGPGDTITITGKNFPGPRTVDIFITPAGTDYPKTTSGTASIAADGTLSASFTLPADAGGVALRGRYLTILVRDAQSGYYGFNTVANPRP